MVVARLTARRHGCLHDMGGSREVRLPGPETDHVLALGLQALALASMARVADSETAAIRAETRCSRSRGHTNMLAQHAAHPHPLKSPRGRVDKRARRQWSTILGQWAVTRARALCLGFDGLHGAVSDQTGPACGRFFCCSLFLTLWSTPATAAALPPSRHAPAVLTSPVRGPGKPIAPQATVALPPSAAYVLVDVNTGNVLAADNEHLRLPPASLTKVLTALIAVDYLRRAPGSAAPKSR